VASIDSLIDEVAPQQQDDPFDLLGRSLSQQLGPFGYQWLCACAVFPVLHPALTLCLGDEIAAATGRKRPNEDEVLTICRLPWFRKGWMPEELRQRLAHDIADPLQDTVRSTISRFIYSVLEASSQSNDRPPPLRLVTPPHNWNSVLDHLVAVGSQDTGPDGILLSFMNQTTTAPVRLSKSARKNAARSGLRDLLELRTIALFVMATIAGALIWLFTNDIASLVQHTATIIARTPTTAPTSSPASQNVAPTPTNTTTAAPATTPTATAPAPPTPMTTAPTLPPPPQIGLPTPTTSEPAAQASTPTVAPSAPPTSTTTAPTSSPAPAIAAPTPTSTTSLPASAPTSKAADPTSTPTDPVTTTYLICTGEFEKACEGRHDVFLPCGQNPEAWLRARCTSYKLHPLSARGGNRCGYAIFEAICFEQGVQKK
jgi:hypothetical protein